MNPPQKCNITSCDINIRVRYCEVDRMGVLHHSRHAVFFEMGRTELLRTNGYDYRTLEDAGTFLVVVKLDIDYKAPAHYDDILNLNTSVTKVDRVRIHHKYLLTRPADNKIIAQAESILVCVDKNSKVQPIPQFLHPD